MGLFKSKYLGEKEEAPETTQDNLTNYEVNKSNAEAIESLQDLDDTLSIEEMEARTRIRQRRELARAEVERKKMDRKEFLVSFRNATTIVYYLIYTAVLSVYMYILCDILLASIAIGMIGGVLLTYWFVYRDNVMKTDQINYRNLTNLATQIDFNMQNGMNVSNTLDSLKDSYEGSVGTELRYTSAKLKADAELETSNFDKYGFTSFDVFLRNLKIQYIEGISPKKLFKIPLTAINFEWIQRKNLLNKNRNARKVEFLSLFIMGAIPLMLRFVASDVYGIFLGYPNIAFCLATFATLAMAKFFCMVQKGYLNISVSL